MPSQTLQQPSLHCILNTLSAKGMRHKRNMGIAGERGGALLQASAGCALQGFMMTMMMVFWMIIIKAVMG